MFLPRLPPRARVLSSSVRLSRTEGDGTFSKAADRRIEIEKNTILSKHKQHPSGDLNDALERIIYEIWMYRQSTLLYEDILRAGGNAAIEFQIHSRVLLAFFYGPAAVPRAARASVPEQVRCTPPQPATPHSRLCYDSSVV